MSRADLSDPEIKTSFEDIKGNGSTNWILLAHVPKSDTKYKVAATGTGGLPELQEQFNDGRVQFALLKMDLGGVKKFVYIAWCGEGVTGMKKGLFNNHSQDVSFLWKGFHVQVNARSEADISEKEFLHRLKTATGASFYKKSHANQSTESTPETSNITYEKRDQDQSTENRPSQSTISYETRAIDQSTESKPVQSTISYEKRGLDQSTENKPVTSRFNPQQQQQGGGAPPRPAPGKLSVGAPKNTAPPPMKQAPPPSNNKPAPPPATNKPAPPPVSNKPAPAPPKQPEPEPEPEPEPVQEPEPEPEPAQETYDEQGGYEQTDQSYDQSYDQNYQEGGNEYEGEGADYTNQEGDYGSSGGLARALYDYDAENADDLSFKEGDMINVLDKSDPSGWWEGELNGKRGFFPSNFVEEQ